MKINNNISYQQNNQKLPSFQGYLVKSGQKLLPAFLDLFESAGRKEFYSLNKIPIGEYMTRAQATAVAQKMVTRDNGLPIVDVFLNQAEFSELMGLVEEKGFPAAKVGFERSFRSGKGSEAHATLVKFKEENGSIVFEKVLEFIKKADEVSNERYQKMVQNLRDIKSELI